MTLHVCALFFKILCFAADNFLKLRMLSVKISERLFAFNFAGFFETIWPFSSESMETLCEKVKCEMLQVVASDVIHCIF